VGSSEIKNIGPWEIAGMAHFHEKIGMARSREIENIKSTEIAGMARSHEKWAGSHERRTSRALEKI